MFGRNNDGRSQMRRARSGEMKGGKDGRGVVYVGRIPHGFYETQMRRYFSQFGKVNKVNVARNVKTGASRHYGFVEFESMEVAKIVAETMNDYLMYGHILKCAVVPEDKIPVNAFRRKRVKCFDGNYERKENTKASVPKNEVWLNAFKERRKEKQEHLKNMGIDYELPEITRISE